MFNSACPTAWSRFIFVRSIRRFTGPQCFCSWIISEWIKCWFSSVELWQWWDVNGRVWVSGARGRRSARSRRCDWKSSSSRPSTSAATGAQNWPPSYVWLKRKSKFGSRTDGPKTNASRRPTSTTSSGNQWLNPPVSFLQQRRTQRAPLLFHRQQIADCGYNFPPNTRRWAQFQTTPETIYLFRCVEYTYGCFKHFTGYFRISVCVSGGWHKGASHRRQPAFLMVNSRH